MAVGIMALMMVYDDIRRDSTRAISAVAKVLVTFRVILSCRTDRCENNMLTQMAAVRQVLMTGSAATRMYCDRTRRTCTMSLRTSTAF